MLLPQLVVSVALTLIIILAIPSKGHTSKRYQSGADDLSITVVTNGSYSIAVKGDTWLNNAVTYFNVNNRTYNASNGSLKLIQTSVTSGVDGIGKWQSTVFMYQIKDAPKTNFSAIIKVYQDLPVILFQQVWTDGAAWTQGKTYEHVCAGFPGFKMEGPDGRLGFLSYGGDMFGDTNKMIGSWGAQTSSINEGISGGPLALFDTDGRTVIFAPFNNFMSASFLHDGYTGGNYYGGIMGGVSHVPAGYHQDFMLYYGTGINKAFEGWGKLMRNYYGKKVSTQANDLTITHLGYWTDNGAFYYYNTEKGKTYQQTVFDVNDYIHKMKIPYRYMQYDSWWYYKGVDDGVKTWVSRPDVFPDGFVNVSKAVGYPAAAHNRYWASDTTYAKQNGGKYDFIVERSKALPVSRQFWDDLFAEGKTWGLVLYEQDWLNVEFSGLDALLHNLTLGAQWLTQMADAASQAGIYIQYCMSNPRHAMQALMYPAVTQDWLNVEFSGLDALLHNLTLGAQWLTQMADAASQAGIYIQYCMSNPRHAMQALMYPAVTQARVSNDYQPGNHQWSIGISSIFAAAMGVAPFKDTFWTTETQPGNPYNKTEPNWKLNAVVSTLSTGPVGPSDMIGATDIPTLMKCCRTDGVILKPQYPIRAIDGQILKAAFPGGKGPAGEAWVSYTEFSGLKFANILVLNLANGTKYTMYPQDTGLFDSNVSETELYAVPYDEPSGWTGFSSLYGLEFTDKFNPTRIALYHVSQAIPGWFETAILGELDKWAPISPQRVRSVSWTNAKVTVPLIGDANEKFDFWYILGSKENAVTCLLSDEGTATFVMDNELGIATCK